MAPIKNSEEIAAEFAAQLQPADSVAGEADPVINLTGANPLAAPDPMPLPPSADELPESTTVETDNTAVETDNTAVETDNTATVAPATLRKLCVHCGWDQSRPSVVEPDGIDKLSFLQAILGQKLFDKQFALLGGNLRLKFRSLTVREIDELYAEAFRQSKQGLVTNPAEFYETINRHRLFLQLTSLQAAKNILHISLPDGLTAQANPDAKQYWDLFLANKQTQESGHSDKSLLSRVQDYMLTHVLKTESMHRLAAHTCNQFNQYVAKLEACVDDPNFWNATALPR